MMRTVSVSLRIVLPVVFLAGLPSLALARVDGPASLPPAIAAKPAASPDTQAAAPGNGVKIGVINFQAVLANTAEGKKTFADLQTKYAPQQSHIEHLQQEIDLDQAQLTKEQAALSSEQQARLSHELEVKQRDLKRTTEDAQNDFTHDRDEAVNRLGQKIVRVISDYANQNGFELILDEAQVPVYFVSPRIDVTKDIIARYDAANPMPTAGQ